MIDFHTHILPGIDDGSQDIRTTGEMLREEKRQGTELVIATPHFYASRMAMETFLRRRTEAMTMTERLRREADELLPEILPGAEVYYFPGMGESEGIDRLCIGETRTILVELPFEQWDEGVLKDMKGLIQRQRLNVVLAHIERYPMLQRDRRIWDRVTALPLTPQINTGSFVRRGGLFHTDRVRKFCLRFLAEHHETIIGSDCHNMQGRPPNLAQGETEIKAALGVEVIRKIEATAGRLLTR